MTRISHHVFFCFPITSSFVVLVFFFFFFDMSLPGWSGCRVIFFMLTLHYILYFIFKIITRVVNSPDTELKITTQVIRDGVFARQLQYEEQNPSPRTPDIDTVRQSMRDEVYARQLAKYQTLGFDV